jgi:hypothetical protein
MTRGLPSWTSAAALVLAFPAIVLGPQLHARTSSVASDASIPAVAQAPATVDLEALPFAPRHYVCYRAAPAPAIDGRLDDPAWREAPWTEAFVDIEGDSRPRPRFSTRVKMLWDATYLYVASEMEEPEVWAALTERDSIVYNDNDFEVFIDPDGDTHNYYELEVNPLGTVFDLLLIQPYRDGGPPIIAWDVSGLKLAVGVRGTLNHPGDRDDGWTVEMAMPWQVLREAAPGKRPPQPGEHWRVNFSRVEWQADVKDGRYARRTDTTTGKPVAADNWSWSPQGAVNLHMPERWGFVQFSAVNVGQGTEAFVEDPNDRVKWALRRLYYRQRSYRVEHGRYADTLAALGVNNVRVEGLAFVPSLEATANLYEITAAGAAGATVHIRQDGKVWITRANR